MKRRYLCLQDFEDAARRQLPRSVFGFIEGGAEDGASVRANREAFGEVSLVPRVLRDSSARSAAVHALGRRWAAPFGIAPMGAAGVAALQGDLVLAQAAAEADIPFVLSGSSLIAMERVIRVNEHAAFQAYLSTDATHNERLLTRVELSGFRTLVVTLDVPVAGNRESDVRNGYASPLRPSMQLAWDAARHPNWLLGTCLRSLRREGMPHFENLADAQRVPMISRHAVRGHRRDNFGWDALARLRERWPHRLVLKGVLSAEDLPMAKQQGIDAVIVSNHGGRQLDGAIAAFSALPAVVAHADSIEVLMDSGVRRGTDVLKALSQGASMVYVGRPFLYAAAVDGLDGVRRAIELLRAEVERNLALLGCRSPADVGSCVVAGAPHRRLQATNVLTPP